MDNATPFQHRHFAHCESGVMALLLGHQGLPLSEPMVFGLASALSFAFVPIIKLGNLPLIAYRMPPGRMVKLLPRMLGISWHRQKFRKAEAAMAALDSCLAEGHVVGIQTSAYFTTYFPPDMRFQFNAHNAIVYGREGDEYLISDPVFDTPQRILREDLEKARFAKGVMAPKGFMHYPLQRPGQVNLEPLIKKAVVKQARIMLHAPPFFGLKGIRQLAKHVAKLDQKHDQKYTRHFLGNMVRMQEEIGTGGGGFRFLYAAFLQESYELLGLAQLGEASEKTTQAGDTWREFALACAKAVKRKDSEPDLNLIAALLRRCAEAEEEVFRLLKKV